jgi:alpha-glucosidase (family GH31 glycosyl hydrolase)
LLLSRKPGGGYLVFYENPHEAFLDLSGDVGLVAFSGGALRYYLFPGGPKEALAAYTALTGRPPLPPRFALGLHFARWGLRTEEEAREVVEGFFAHDLPLSALHLDIAATGSSPWTGGVSPIWRGWCGTWRGGGCARSSSWTLGSRPRRAFPPLRGA